MTDRDQVLVTKGVTSYVYAVGEEGEPEGRGGRYGVGHIALFDWDDHVGPGDVEGHLHEHGIDGPTVVLESSEGNLHGWNLTVRDFAETAAVLERGNDDTKHRSVGVDRGWWRLRAGPKLTADDDVYKPAPEVIDVVSLPLRDRFRRISAPHAELLERLHGHLPMDPDLPGRGNMVETVTYSTFSDVGKELQRRSWARDS